MTVGRPVDHHRRTVRAARDERDVTRVLPELLVRVDADVRAPVAVDVAHRAPVVDVDAVGGAAADHEAARPERRQVDRRGVPPAEHHEHDGGGPLEPAGLGLPARDRHVVQTVAVDVTEPGDHRSGAAVERVPAAMADLARERHGTVDAKAATAEMAERDPPARPAAEHHVRGPGVGAAQAIGERRPDDEVLPSVAVHVPRSGHGGAGEVGGLSAHERLCRRARRRERARGRRDGRREQERAHGEHGAGDHASEHGSPARRSASEIPHVAFAVELRDGGVVRGTGRASKHG